VIGQSGHTLSHNTTAARSPPRSSDSNSVLGGISSTAQRTAGLVEGNYIGTNLAGTQAIPNTGPGVVIRWRGREHDRQHHRRCRQRDFGQQPGRDRGLGRQQPDRGNRSGPAPPARRAANNGDGIDVFSSANTIGGTTAAAGNDLGQRLPGSRSSRPRAT
jgi:hypothetical protein